MGTFSWLATELRGADFALKIQIEQKLGSWHKLLSEI